MFYIATVNNPNPNSNDTGVLFNPKLTITPVIDGGLLNTKIEFYVYGNFNIPVNTILLSLETNYGKYSEINLSKKYTKSENDNYYVGNFVININESKFLQEQIQNKTKLVYVPKFTLNTAALNEAQLTLDSTNVAEFVSKISAYDENIIKTTNYYSNTYSLVDLWMNLINENEINKPKLKINSISVDIINQHWNTFNKFLKISNYYSNSNYVQEYKINFNYLINNKKKNYLIESTKDKTYEWKSNIYTNFNYETNEVELTNKYDGFDGIFIPLKTQGNVIFSFKMNNTWFTQKFSFRQEQDLFNENGKFKLVIKQDE